MDGDLGSLPAQNSPSNVVRALVLSGGGARGAFEAGAIESLKAFGPYDIICGTSAGAINAAFVAQGAYNQLREVWHNIGARSVIQYVNVVRHVVALISSFRLLTSGPPLGRIGALFQLIYAFASVVFSVMFRLPSVLRLLGAIKPNPITEVLTEYLSYSALQRWLIVTATNLTRQSADTFYFSATANMSAFAAKRKIGTARYPLTSSNYVSAVQASTSIPGAFPPVEVAADGAHYQYVDGGVANNTPIGMAVDAGATEITIVFVDPADSEPPEQTISNLAQIGMTCLNVMQHKILEDDLKLALAYNSGVAAGASFAAPLVADKRVITIYVVRPEKPLSVGVLDFEKQPLLDQAYDAGLAAGQKRQKL